MYKGSNLKYTLCKVNKNDACMVHTFVHGGNGEQLRPNAVHKGHIPSLRGSVGDAVVGSICMWE